MRCLQRESNPDCEEICRRFLADLQDFDDIPFEHYCHYNGAKTDPNWIIEDLTSKGFLTKVD